MKIIAALAVTIVILGWAETPMQAAEEPFPVIRGKAYKFEKVAEGVYYASEGVGSNDVVIVNDRDVVLVDDGSTPAAARALLRDIALITNKPVKTVVNTHFHYDHTDGNSALPPDVQIIGQEYVRTAILTFDVLHREPFKTSQGDRIAEQIVSLKAQLAAAKEDARKTEAAKELAAAEAFGQELGTIEPTPPNVTYASKMVLYKGARDPVAVSRPRPHRRRHIRLPAARAYCLHGRHGRGRADCLHGGCFFR